MSWKTVQLGSVCEILDSKRKPITKRDRTKGEYPYYGATGIVDYVGDYIFDEKLVLIGEDGAKWESGDKTAFIAEGRYWVNNHAHVIKPDRNSVLDEWLVYYFYFKDLREFVTGLTVPKLNQGQLKIISIPLPSLATQQKIVAKLDAIFAEIDKATAAAEANAKNAEALFQSYLTEVFENDLSTYVERSINDITIKTKNISPDKNPLQEFTYVDVSSVSNESFEIVSTQKLLGKEAPSRAKKHILENDILFATVRPTLKRIALVPSELSNQVASTGYVVLRASKDALPKFIFYFLFSKRFMEQMTKLQKGASYPAVTDSDVKNQRLSVPPFDIQKIVTEKIDAVFEKCSLISKINQSRVIELVAIKKSILKQAFSGELVKE